MCHASPRREGQAGPDAAAVDRWRTSRIGAWHAPCCSASMTQNLAYGRWFAFVGVAACAAFAAACASSDNGGTPGAGGSGGQGGRVADGGGAGGTAGSGGGDAGGEAAAPMGPAIRAKAIAVGVD